MQQLPPPPQYGTAKGEPKAARRARALAREAPDDAGEALSPEQIEAQRWDAFYHRGQE